ncbi:uncharacterized protein LOC126839862 [Adelges cooleyi]|uniref:uncharacterized protein LOC126839862 n=1 Tax=Adelges cooleyi TaxID=133065 RepID=UPI00217FD1CD|nr:uncharacterized protein LOC126839862 [Adelges cooleyi]
MTGKLSLLLILGTLAAMSIVSPSVEARYLPTRGTDDRLTRLKELLTDLLNTDVQQPNYELERSYVDHGDPIGDYSRLSVPREYNVPEKTLMELFNPAVPHHQRPRS